MATIVAGHEAAIDKHGLPRDFAVITQVLTGQHMREEGTGADTEVPPGMRLCAQPAQPSSGSTSALASTAEGTATAAATTPKEPQERVLVTVASVPAGRLLHLLPTCWAHVGRCAAARMAVEDACGRPCRVM